MITARATSRLVLGLCALGLCALLPSHVGDARLPHLVHALSDFKATVAEALHEAETHLKQLTARLSHSPAERQSLPDKAPDPIASDTARSASPAAPPLPDPATQLGLDITGVREAIAAYKAGELADGDLAASKNKDTLVQVALEWVALRTLPRQAGFERLDAFVKAHPDWPSTPWLRRRAEEALYGDRRNPALVKRYFGQIPPETPAGKLALAKVLEAEGKVNDAAALVRDVWREADFNTAIEAHIKSDFGAYLTPADHKYRGDRLLYKEQIGPALRAATAAGPNILTLAKARSAVINEAGDKAIGKAFAAVPPALQTDPGFLFSKIQYLRRTNKIAEAVEIMNAAPRDPALLINGDEWWVERRLLARKLLDRDDAKGAYKLCANHAARSNEMRIEAEFHAGWIALRFLSEPSLAAKHFASAAGFAETPMSIARASYWQGRAAEASPDPDVAQTATSFYEKAAANPTTYYGQLAQSRLGNNELALRSLPEAATGNDRSDTIRTIELLYALGEKELVFPLVVETAQRLSGDAQVAAFAAVIAKQREARVSLVVGKFASYRGIALDSLAYPTYGIPGFEPLQKSAPKSLVYSIARQESAFNPKAVSQAGAKGLMQMIDSTARRTAQNAGIAFDEDRMLSDAAFNAQLGAAHLGELLTEHGGSYILTFAAYNAGGKRVKQWIESYGDPRTPGVDPVDWVERIPFTETRNYVQRIIENLNIYRARFGESKTALGEADLRLQAKL
jgi:soluble lytic murein transglycosylase